MWNEKWVLIVYLIFFDQGFHLYLRLTNFNSYYSATNLKRMKYFLLLFFIGSGYSIYSQCMGNETAVNLGNDTTLCSGETLILSAPLGYDSYEWSNGSNSSGITVNGPNTYWVNGSVIGSNTILNGDFEGGTTAASNNFSTGYIIGTGGAWGLLSDPGTYGISTSPNYLHSNFYSCTDHTSGSGNMLVANGSGTAGSSVWCQTVTVNPNTDFIFSCWAMNVISDANISNLQFFINGVQIGNIFSTTPTGCEWLQFNDTWNSGSSTSAQLCIVNQNITGGGNDFALDDIYFAPICILTDTIVVSYDSYTVSAGPDLTFCENSSEVLIASSNEPTSVLSWSNGIVGDQTTPLASGVYTLTGTSASGCEVSDNATVTIIPMDWGIDQVTSIPADCASTTGIVNVTTSGNFDPAYPPIYEWSGPGAGNPTVFNGSNWTGLDVGWYYIDISSQGCHLNDSIEVFPTNPPVAVAVANPAIGYTPLAVNFQNNSLNANSYLWDFGNGSIINVNDLSAQNQVYNTGTYIVELIAYNGNCSDTTYVTIIVTEPVSLETSNVFTPNGDDVNDTFIFKTENIVKLNVSILNRWGQLVFQSDSPDFFWDGKINGLSAEEGVYFYIYTAVGAQNEQFEGHGFLHLEL